MDDLFSSDYQLLWTGVLALSLFFPVRKMIWVMSIRRFERKEGPVDEAMQTSLKRRAGVTAGLLSLVFSFFYVNFLFIR